MPLLLALHKRKFESFGFFNRHFKHFANLHSNMDLFCFHVTLNWKKVKRVEKKKKEVEI